MAMKKASGKQLKLDAQHLLQDKKQEKLQTMLIKVKFLSYVYASSRVSHKSKSFFEGQERISCRNEATTDCLSC